MTPAGATAWTSAWASAARPIESAVSTSPVYRNAGSPPTRRMTVSSAALLATLARPSICSRAVMTSESKAASCSGSPDTTSEKLPKAPDNIAPPDTVTFSAPKTFSAFSRAIPVSSSTRSRSSTPTSIPARVWSIPPPPMSRAAMACIPPAAPISHCLVPRPSTSATSASNWSTRSAVSDMVVPLGRSTFTVIRGSPMSGSMACGC